MLTTPWMKFNRTKSYYKIYNAHLSKLCHTGNLEFYHSFLTKYFPKRQDFEYDQMNCRTAIAVIDHKVSQNTDQTVDEHELVSTRQLVLMKFQTGLQNLFCITPLMLEQLDLNFRDIFKFFCIFSFKCIKFSNILAEICH